MESLVATGSHFLDSLLNGGYEKDIITTLYGPAASGKTLLCMLPVIGIARQGKKTIYIDTEGGFSIERLKQLAPDYEEVIKNIVFFRPTNFKEQKDAFEKLKDAMNDNIGLIVVDSIAMLYRIELGQSKDVYDVNKDLGLQLSFLTEIARKKNIPIIITNQVYADFDNKDNVKMVGGDILKYGSKCLIELKKMHRDKRIAIVKKHRSIESERAVVFRIVNKGIEEGD
ncbi:MAG: DNA repair and recombination protein RadB [Nanoarchaeota archaeon]|nr:DNA repair and recombination protein RadB [Nanoarchaeota archaeon]MBU1704788.1 DNA repair and recombination protein RadB [Nanoarchaeota archaeon]